MFIIFLLISILSFTAIWYFSERDNKIYKIAIVTGATSFILLGAFFPTDRVIDHMSTIESSDFAIKSDIYRTRTISHKNFE